MLPRPAAETLVLRECTCGLKYTLDEWLRLPLVGYYRDDAVVLQLRNCVCGSTISVEVKQ